MNNQFFEYSIDELHNCDAFLDYVTSLREDKTNQFAQVICHDGIYSTDEQYTYKRSWYIENLEVIAQYMENHSLDEKQEYIVYYLILIRFMANVEERNKNVLNDQDYDYFLQLVKRSLNKISIDTVLNAKFKNIKYGKVLTRYFLEMLGKTSYFSKMQKEERSTITIQCMNYHKDVLSIDVMLEHNVFAQQDSIELYALVGENKLPVRQTKRYSAVKFFGKIYFQQFVGSLEISLLELLPDGKIIFERIEEGSSAVLSIHFSSIHSKLCEKFEKSYWNVSKYTISYNEHEKAIKIERRTVIGTFKREVGFWLDSLKKGTSFSRSVKSILLRCCYYVLYPCYKNRTIWITFDQLYKSGDNGEYFFKYVSELPAKKETIYYVIKKNTKAYRDLKQKYPCIIIYNSFRHKLISLYAKAIFTTRTEVHLCCGYWDELEVYFRGLFQPEIFCLQHGVTIQEIAKYQNRVYDNIKLYFCVSEKEVDNLKQPSYDYKKENLLLTGSPRYDGLVNTKEKMILISPTWRRSLVNGENKKGELHEYNPNFKESSYYKIYQELLKDKTLLTWASTNGYRIVFLLHPILSVQKDDFYYQSPVELISGSSDISYESYLNKASLLITDYSGIQFDFAYMKKPIIYFQPEDLPAQYGMGGLVYETEGFGPICKTISQLVEKVFEYETNPDSWDVEYLHRVQAFFKFHDGENCKRIYQAVKEYESN